MKRDVAPVSPGEVLLEEFLKPMGISQYRLAKEIGVSQRRIGEIIAGKRAVTADTDLRVCRFFRLSAIGYAPKHITRRKKPAMPSPRRSRTSHHGSLLNNPMREPCLVSPRAG